MQVQDKVRLPLNVPERFFSVSPAEEQPGSSGHHTAQSSVSGSGSSTTRHFIEDFSFDKRYNG
ncbi:hypothetical protein [Leptolyngbya sp. 7M]|uniref:hypothetical protein n=1 Tax=Leptolyngbya sp. 7M TaxID=2812896 RepID=UPI001B8C83E3|nr:hypothetical protein [Leptolyngbya sp. 7M]QYO67613.1 hypothetical protein JVX88_12940 [Leptolyngbya sp. 7M]